MELKPESLAKFKEFMQNGHTENSLEKTQLVCDLFTKLKQETYKDQSILEKASDFVDLLLEKLDEEGINKCYIGFQIACIDYLLKEVTISSDKVKEEIAKHLKQPTPKNYKQIFLELMKETGGIENPSLKDELIDFLSLFEKHIGSYNFRLRNLNFKYNQGKQIIPLYIFLLIGATEKFLVNRHSFEKSFFASEESNYLSVPSNSHQKINPKEVIFILARTQLNEGEDRFTGTEIKEKIDKLQTKPEKIFLFTLDSKLTPDLFLEFKNNNVQLVTTKSVIKKHYSKNKQIIALEELLKLCKEKQLYGDNYKFSQLEKQELQKLLRRKLKAYSRSPIFRDGYQEQLDKLTTEN